MWCARPGADVGIAAVGNCLEPFAGSREKCLCRYRTAESQIPCDEELGKWPTGDVWPPPGLLPNRHP